MTDSLTGFDRAAAIERICGRLQLFDDVALVELDRLTDEATYATTGGMRSASGVAAGAWVGRRSSEVDEHDRVRLARAAIRDSGDRTGSDGAGLAGAAGAGAGEPGHSAAREPSSDAAPVPEPAKAASERRASGPSAGVNAGAARGVDRRRLLAGGAAVAAAGTTAALAWRSGVFTSPGGAGAADGGALAIRGRGDRLLSLYQRLDALDLDARVRAAMGLISTAVTAALLTADTLEAGIGIALRALETVESALAPVRAGLARLEILFGRIDALLARLGDAIGAGTDSIAQTVAGFLQDIADGLPAGLATSAGEGLKALADLVSSLPDAMEAGRQDLVAPLRSSWLPDEASGDPDVSEQLFVPLRDRVFAPGRELVTGLRQIDRAWSEGFDPVQELLDERAAVRREIEALAL